MHSRYRGLGAAVVLTGALALGALGSTPALAYTPSGPDSVQIDAGATGRVEFGGFPAGVDVTVTLTGDNASAGALAVVGATDTIRIVKDSGDGSFPVDVTLPARAAGTYSLVATDGDRTVTVYVDSGTASASGQGTSAASDGAQLARTGEEGELLLALWVGGGLIVLAGGALVVAHVVRRQTQPRRTGA